MSVRTMVIVNPASGGGATGRTWPALRGNLESALEVWDECFTSAPEQATELARNAIRAGYEQLVVVGGDGTLNEVVNGFFEPDPVLGVQNRRVGSPILAPVRRGTGGDFARLLKLPGRGPQVFRHLVGDRVRPLDLGWCRFQNHQGQARCRAFVNVASFGLSGLVDAKVNASSKALGSASFVQAIGAALLEYRRRPVRVRVDGSVLYEGPLVLGAVANGAYFGGGLRIAPEACLDDGLLEVVLLLEAGPREVVRAWQVYSGGHTRWSSARVARGRVIEAEALDEMPCLLDLDGEQPGALSARFEALPAVVSMRAG